LNQYKAIIDQQAEKIAILEAEKAQREAPPQLVKTVKKQPKPSMTKPAKIVLEEKKRGWPKGKKRGPRKEKDNAVQKRRSRKKA
jgi:hypothetical protein